MTTETKRDSLPILKDRVSLSPELINKDESMTTIYDLEKMIEEGKKTYWDRLTLKDKSTFLIYSKKYPSKKAEEILSTLGFDYAK